MASEELSRFMDSSFVFRIGRSQKYWHDWMKFVKRKMNAVRREIKLKINACEGYVKVLFWIWRKWEKQQNIRKEVERGSRLS